jgi:hypothetical protein
MSTTETAVAHCAHCPWQAKITGDDMIDIVGSLRKILIDHVMTDHPERVGEQSAIVYRNIVEEGQS